jgi:hypothetical protein
MNFLYPTAFFAEHPIDYGIGPGAECPAHDALFSKSDVTEERPDGLVRGLGNGGQPGQAKLSEWVRKNSSQNPPRTPSRGCAGKGDLDIRLPEVIEHGACEEISAADYPDRSEGSEIVDPNLFAHPTSNKLVTTNQQSE